MVITQKPVTKQVSSENNHRVSSTTVGREIGTRPPAKLCFAMACKFFSDEPRPSKKKQVSLTAQFTRRDLFTFLVGILECWRILKILFYNPQNQAECACEVVKFRTQPEAFAVIHLVIISWTNRTSHQSGRFDGEIYIDNHNKYRRNAILK